MGQGPRTCCPSGALVGLIRIGGRVELGLAIEHGIPLLPLLVGGASMPASESLPEHLRVLSYANALTIREGPDWEADMAR